MVRFKPNTEAGETHEKKSWNVERERYDSSEEWTVEQEMVRSVLESFNEPLLHQILYELAGKAGVDLRTVGFPSLDQVKIILEESLSGGGQTSRVEVAINEIRLSHDGSRVAVYQVLWCIIHEFLHELSTVPVEESADIKEGVYRGAFVGKTGVSKDSINVELDLGTGETKNTKSQDNKFINEGITEWLTGRVFDEYIRRTGDAKLRTTERKERIESIRGAYWVERLNVELYIIFLSELLEQPISVIEGSIIRTYLRNGEIIPEEVLDVLGIPTKNKNLALSLFRERINEHDFAQLLVDLKSRLPEDRQESFHRRVVSKFNKVANAVEVYNSKYV